MDEKVENKPKEIANRQVEYFFNKIEEIKINLKMNEDNPLKFLKEAMERWEEKDKCPQFEIRETTLTDTLEEIKTLGNSTAQGDDKLDSITIKAAAGLLCGPINHITNMSIRSGIFCNKWKLGKVIPLFRGDQMTP